MRVKRAAAAVGAALMLTLAVVAWMFLAPPSLGGGTRLVTTHGISMSPRFTTGDLAVVRPASAYEVGDVVAYRSALLHTVVMHRITAVDPTGLTLKGDHNTWLDPDHPTPDAVVGALVLRVPQGGVWLGRITSPSVLAAAAFLLVLGGGTSVQRRRSRRRSAASTHASTRRAPARAGSLPRGAWAAAGIAATVTALGGAASGLAWAAPTTSWNRVATTTPRQMTFAYSTQVPASAAYDTTTVRSPQPVFRQLAHRVDLVLGYRGEPGTLRATAELATSSGWQSQVALADATAVPGTGSSTTVPLDIDALYARAQAGARATGIPAGALTVRLVASVTRAGAATFAPALEMVLDERSLRLSGKAADLVVTDAGKGSTRVRGPGRLGWGSHTVRVSAVRVLAPGFAVVGLLALMLSIVVGRRLASRGEAARIRRRYASLLVEVAPMSAPPGRPMVEVTEFATLARLAERYGLLVLHWCRSGTETFVVQDESTTFRYRAEAPRAVGQGTHRSSEKLATDRG